MPHPTSSRNSVTGNSLQHGARLQDVPQRCITPDSYGMVD